MRINKLFSAWSFASSQREPSGVTNPVGALRERGFCAGIITVDVGGCAWTRRILEESGGILLLLDFTAQRANLAENCPRILWETFGNAAPRCFM